MPAKKAAKKKPLTKTESNKRYLARKKAKEFEAALESPPAVISIPDDGLKTIANGTEPEWTQGSIFPHTRPSKLTPEEEVFLTPTNTNFDDDDWEPYAPKANNVPLAGGETQETAIKPGNWHSIDQAKDSLEKSVIEAQDALEEASIQFSYNLPTDSVERLQQAIDAIKWLSQKNKNLPPRTKEILRLRIARLEEIIYALK